MRVNKRLFSLWVNYPFNTTNVLKDYTICYVNEVRKKEPIRIQ